MYNLGILSPRCIILEYNLPSVEPWVYSLKHTKQLQGPWWIVIKFQMHNIWTQCSVGRCNLCLLPTLCENLSRISFSWRAKHSALLEKNEFSSFLIFYLLTALLAQKHLDLLTNKKGKLQRRGPQSSGKWLTTSPRKSLREVEVHQNINLILYNNHLTNYQPSCSNYH